ncbi:MAG: glycosyltransferase family 4 protein, partial [Asticcacaulis sp.]
VSRGQGSILLSPLYVMNVLFALLAGAISKNIDVVHINLSQDGSSHRKLIIASFCRFLKIPYVLHLHGSHYHTFWNKASPSLNSALTRMFAGSAGIVVLGNVWRDFIIGKVPSAAGKIAILPTATQDPGKIERPKSDGSVPIFFSGRHGDRKGVWELTAALGRLAGEPSWRATLTGDGDIEKTREEVKKLNIAERVSVPGWISDQEFRRLLDEAQILALPSHDENLPLSVVEAFARGIAVISTDVGALPDIVENEKTGLVIQPGDVDGLTQAIERLLNDKALREKLGKNGRAMYEQRLNLAAYVNNMTAVWRKAAQA